MIAAIRMRGVVGARKEAEDTLRMLGLKKKYNLAMLPRNDSILGMIKKAEHMLTWGEVDNELMKELKEKYGKPIDAQSASFSVKINLKPPRKGLKSVKKRWPKGDVGYRGAAINDLIKRMM